MLNSSIINKKWLGIFILFLIFFFFSILPIIILKIFKKQIKNLLPQPLVIKTPCFQFNLNTYFKPTNNNNPYRCIIEEKNSDTFLNISPLIYNDPYIKNKLQTFAEIDEKRLLNTFSNVKIESRKKINFAGMSGYGYTAIYKENKKIKVFWVYSPSSKKIIDNINIKVFNIVLIAPETSFDNILKNIEASWKWVNQSKQINLDKKIFSTPCYEIKSKIELEETYKINDCDLSLKLMKKSNLIGIIGIHQFNGSNNLLYEEIDNWKNNWKNLNKNIQIISEKNLKIGNKPAYQIIFKISPSSDTLHSNIFIYTSNLYEKIFGHPNNGFIINFIYNEKSEMKSNIDYLLSNWKWL